MPEQAGPLQPPHGWPLYLTQMQLHIAIPKALVGGFQLTVMQRLELASRGLYNITKPLILSRKATVLPRLSLESECTPFNYRSLPNR